MIPTYIGFTISGIAIILLARFSALAMFSMLILCGLFSGAAAISLPALGGSSIPPVSFCLGFLLLRLLVLGSQYGPIARQAFRQNILLWVFALYGIAIALIGPHLFGNVIKVVPMRGTDAKIWATYPLVFSPQNITTSFYLFATAVTATCAYVVCRLRGGAETLVGTAVVLVAIHMTLGVVSVLFANTPVMQALSVFRNGNYAQLDQSVNGYVRMTGIMPEPSAFAGFGFTWGVFLIECWYRDVRPRITGGLGLAMVFILLASTSSTAYVSIAAYMLLFLLRIVLVPDRVRVDKILVVSVVATIVAALIVITLLAVPALVEQLTKMVADLTVHKQTSTSGIQRAFWARQGLSAFVASTGLGIGPGSFRSSSIVTAVLGATGIVGAVSLTCYVILVLKPLRSSTYNRPTGFADATGVAASWAAICLLIPASIASPTADPGSDFAILAGSALALRLRSRPGISADIHDGDGSGEFPKSEALAWRAPFVRSSQLTRPAAGMSEVEGFPLACDRRNACYGNL